MELMAALIRCQMVYLFSYGKFTAAYAPGIGPQRCPGISCIGRTDCGIRKGKRHGKVFSLIGTDGNFLN